MKTNDIIGLGSAILDFLIEIGDDKLLEMDLTKGQGHLVDKDKAHKMLEKINNEQLSIKKVSGGSAANCLKGFAFLGGSAILCGKVGNDEHGDFYVQEIKEHGVSSRIGRNENITGHSLTFISPDAERTFSVHLGAALELYQEDILEEDIAKSKILHLEGYQVEGATRKTIMHAIEFAKKHNTLISIDLADPGVVERNLDFLRELVTNHANIVFVNENEAKAFTGLEEEEAALELAKHAQIAVVKLGAEGSIICSKGEITRIQPFKANAVDTTGAGDCYAAGFLYGFTQGWEFSKAGKLGSLLASKIVEQTGVKITELDVQQIKQQIEES